MGERVFGHLPGQPPGSIYPDRKALAAAGVHRPLQAGISGSIYEGADSIVASEGYEDDVDYGHTLLYTGEGGRDAQSGTQVRDQTLTMRNKALARSGLHGLPVRVVRQLPDGTYRYDGLYRVTAHWREEGRSGFLVWRFRLTRWQQEEADEVAEAPERYDAAPREEALRTRIVRDSTLTREIKELYDYRCQACGERLQTPAGPYAEAAHIRPLGAPHGGPDALGNLLCLCPNHHVLFDGGAFTIGPDHTLVGLEGTFILHKRHRLDPRHLAYHRRHIFVEEA